MSHGSTTERPLMMLTISVAVLALQASCQTPEPMALDEARARPAPAPAQTARARPITSSGAADWRARVQAELDAGCTADPALCEAVRGLEARITRAGSHRITTPLIHDPRAAAVLIDRLASGEEPNEMRAALAEALPRTGGRYDDAAAALIEIDPDPAVRMALVETMRWAGAELAVVGLRHGFADPEPKVRATAARVCGRREDGASLEAELLAALADPDVSTRAWAARSIGVLGIDEATPALLDALDHDSADLRLHALRAIHRLDPELVPTLPQLPTLARDPDSRVARLASELGGRTATLHDPR